MQKVFILTSLIAVVMVFLFQGHRMEKNELKYKAVSAPYSSDPIEFDAEIHHIVFSSIFATLITQYEAGEFKGLVAESWDTYNDNRRWTFKIRENIKFEDGEPITPDAVSKSLRRVTFILKKRQSASPLTSYLLGIENLKSADSNISGITTTKNSITLSFSRPMPNLLKTLSFGLYGITSSKHFHSESGEWKDPKRTISSSFYRLDRWEDDKINLILNKEFLPNLGHASKFEEVIIDWSRRQQDFDLSFDQQAQYRGSTSLLFSGSFDASISYIHCLSWKNPKSIFHKLEHRVKLRDSFYAVIKGNKSNPVKSFFPLAMSGVSEVRDGKERLSSSFITNSEVVTPSIPKERSSSFELNEKIKQALSQNGAKVSSKELSYEDRVKHLDPDFNHILDISPKRSAINIADPIGDIHFMFKSKEGIMLPDATGEIHQLLESSKLDIQKVNQALWDQAIIWPVSHDVTGYWYKQHVDLTRINMGQPPVNFAWIGHK